MMPAQFQHVHACLVLAEHAEELLPSKRTHAQAVIFPSSRTLTLCEPVFGKYGRRSLRPSKLLQEPVQVIRRTWRLSLLSQAAENPTELSSNPAADGYTRQDIALEVKEFIVQMYTKASKGIRIVS